MTTTEGTRLLWAIRAERDLLRAMVTWPEGANGVLAIGAYEAMVRRLHKAVEADAAALTAEPEWNGGWRNEAEPAPETAAPIHAPDPCPKCGAVGGHYGSCPDVF